MQQVYVIFRDEYRISATSQRWIVDYSGSLVKKMVNSKEGASVGYCDSPAGGLGISQKLKRIRSMLLLYVCALFPDPILELVGFFVNQQVFRFRSMLQHMCTVAISIRHLSLNQQIATGVLRTGNREPQHALDIFVTTSGPFVTTLLFLSPK